MKVFIKVIDEMTGAVARIPCEIDFLPKDSIINVQTRNITSFEIEVDYGQGKTGSGNN